MFRHLSSSIPGAKRACALFALMPGLLLYLPASLATDLQSILELAEERDPQYRQAHANALAVAEGIPQARAQLWLPELTLSGGTSKVKQDIDTSGAIGTGGKVDYTTRNWGLNLTQPVFHYDRYRLLKQADKRVQQAQYELDAARQDLIIRVAERYFEVLASQDNLEFAKAEKASLNSQLKQAQQRFDVGLIAITDVQEAKAGYDLAVATAIQARNALDNAGEGLREITGEYHGDLDPLSNRMVLAVPEPMDIDAWTQRSLQQNLELAAAQAATEIAHEDIRIQYAGHLPTVDIVGSHGFNKQGGRFGDTAVTQSDVGIQLSVPLYQGGQVTSKTRAATYRHTEALQRLEQTKRAVFRQTREAYLGITAQISAVKAFDQAVVSSTSAVESTRAGFEVGTRTAVDVVTAERGLFGAKRDYSRARYDYVLEILRLKQASGTLSPEDLAIANAWLEKNSSAL